MREVFLDAASNTAMDKKVFKAMKPYLKKNFVGNSRSIHNYGIRASKAIEDSRKKIAQIMHTDINNVVFTSGATESNNMVIKGLAYKELTSGKPVEEQRRHIICSAIEHDSVINPCKQLEKLGFTVSYVRPSVRSGQILTRAILNKITDKTLLICVMAVNNETGVLNPIDSITSLAAENGIYTLVDCTQYVGYGGKCIELCERFPSASFLTFSGHKIYGPTGTGCLIANGDSLKALSNAGLIIGGAQELGLRGGTSNTAGIVGLGTAVDMMHKQGMFLTFYYKELYDYLISKLHQFGNSVWVNIEPMHKNIISLNCSGLFKQGEIDSLANSLSLEGIAVSASSACDSEHDETAGDFNPSHVLVALGLSEFDIRCTIRISFNIKTTTRDIDRFIAALDRVVLEHQMLFC